MMRTCLTCGKESKYFKGIARCSCGGTFDKYLCAKCDTWLPTKSFSKRYDGKGSEHMPRSACRKCEKKREKEVRARNVDTARAADKRRKQNKDARLDKKFELWKENVARTPSPPLTETEWLKACKHFGGCAICGNERIEARMFFIHFKDGGRYVAHNIIPACAQCAVTVRIFNNPFKWATYSVISTRTKFKTAGLKRVTDYLSAQVKGVTK